MFDLSRRGTCTAGLPVSGSMASTSSLGAILAGGQSRRFGAPKALAEIGGAPIIARVRDALLGAAADVVLITGEPGLFAGLDLPTRPDAVAGAGALSGVHTALLHARGAGYGAVFCVACDMPFLSAPLLRRLRERWEESGAHAVVPASPGPLGFEPLCALYSVAALPEVEARVRRDERALGGLIDALDADRIPLTEVLRFGEPNTLFLNVNTPEDYQRALRIARRTPDTRQPPGALTAGDTNEPE
ncbi:hypothetical protein BH23GEM3_BH23GEM3_02310 [soil metagenome]